LSFDETKNSKYSTWLYNTARFQCLNAIRESSKEICYEPEFMSVYIDNDQNERAMDEINMNELELIEKAKEFIAKIKEPHGRQLMTMRYLQNRPDGKKYTWKEIAIAINYTQQHVHNLHNKYLSELTKFLSYTNEYNAQLAA
jgi:RNA polymerase sigma factor (sigma-70 family)